METTRMAAGGEPVSDGAAQVWPSTLDVEALLLRDFRPARSPGAGRFPAARNRFPSPLRQLARTAALAFPGPEVSAETLAALATGGGAAAVQPLVVAQYGKHVLLVRAVMDMARRTQHPRASHARRGYELLTEVAGHAPGAVEAVLRHPSVGAWGSRTLRALLNGEQDSPAGGPASHEPAQLAALAAAAAIRSHYPCAIEVPVLRGVITLPSVGQVDLSPGPGPDGMANVRYTPEGARVIAGRRLVFIPVDTGADAPGWRGLRPLHAADRGMTLRLVLDDLDPDRMPDAARLGDRLSPAEATRWQQILPRAWNLLASQPGTAAEEIRAAIRVLTPLRPPPYGQISASSREVFGCVGLSPPAGDLALALTLAQEVQHAKLGALMDLVTLTRPDDGQRYQAPWRADPRHADPRREDPQSADGLLQGAYTCLGVSSFWRGRRQAEDGVAASRAVWEFTRSHRAAAQAVGVLLASGQLTEAGRTVVSGMAATLHAWAGE
jgi:HEXXH motif-containing protein